MSGLSPAGADDAAALLTRVVRLDPGALLRLRPAGEGSGLESGGVELWAWLPWEVLVTRRVGGTVETDRTVGAADLLARLGDRGRPDPGVSLDSLASRDTDWRGALPSSLGSAVETVPADVIWRVGRAAARTLAEVGGSGLGGRAVGQRAVRDALLAHVPIVAEAGGTRVEVSQRLVQAVLRMGFLGLRPDGDDPVAVRLAGGWVGLAAGYGSAWHQRRGGLIVRRTH